VIKLVTRYPVAWRSRCLNFFGRTAAQTNNQNDNKESQEGFIFKKQESTDFINLSNEKNIYLLFVIGCFGRM
jgi:hypothetical protein